MNPFRFFIWYVNILLILFLFTASCTDPSAEGLTVFTNATIWTGTGTETVQNGAVSVRDGKIVDVFSLEEKTPPRGAEVIDLMGRFVVPGLINAHGHVGVTKDAIDTGPSAETADNVIAQLRLYARYGITTVVSLGDEPIHAFLVRDSVVPEEAGMARLFLAGDVLNPATVDEARERVATLMTREPDWTKIRVDDGLGTREKMPADVYKAVIDASHEYNTPLAAHIVTLQDAKEVIRNGADLVGHSIRNAPVDEELISLMLENDICITPTLTREVSTYIYAEKPPFFDDPFFLKEVEPWIVERMQDPEVQEMFTGREADFFRNALPLAERNMMDLHNAGVKIAMGTDSGPPARFQGYFEHLEMEMMEAAGMSPIDVLISATRNAALCMQIDQNLGTLEEGKLADFVVLDQNPMESIRNLRSIESVFVGGVRIEN